MPENHDIIFRFHSRVQVSYGDLNQKFERNSGIWDEIKRLAPNCQLRPRYAKLRGNDSSDLAFLIDTARERACMGWGTRPPSTVESFSRSYVLRCSRGADLHGIVNRLLAWDQIKRAYVAYAVTGPAPVPYTTNPDWFRQDYLGPRPHGINAFYAWTQWGGDGEGQDFVDVEGGWKLDHEDFRPSLAGTELLYGVNNIADNPVDVAHGTNVLGVVCAEHNYKGGVGIVPRLNSINLCSHNMSSVDLPDAILTGVLNLVRRGIGGVLLVETQFGSPPLPVEIDDDVYEAILIATNCGIVVVEPAGNGNQSLNGLLPDSGAIMVASAWRPPSATTLGSGGVVTPSASATYPWVRRGDSNYGDRINCFAWGDSVFTTHSTSSQPTTAYQGNFSGTSSAAAIIAGAALSVQGMATYLHGHALRPGHLRALLSSTQLATHSNTFPQESTPWIGVMPNLEAIRQWL